MLVKYDNTKRFRRSPFLFTLTLLSGCMSMRGDPSLVSEMKADLSVFSESISGQVRLLSDANESWLARLALILSAKDTLDVQYYLYHADPVGEMFTKTLVLAAQKGVKVRILLDDYGQGKQDQLLVNLASHENIEVRLFNPTWSRKFKLTETLLRFSLKSRRMHNKTLVADSEHAIIGGRNIGETYFTDNAQTEFKDLDVLVDIEFANKLGEAFDLYWNHKLSEPVARINSLEPEGPEFFRRMGNLDKEQHNSLMHAKSYLRSIQNDDLVRYSVRGQVLVDHPNKLLQPTSEVSGHLMPVMKKRLDSVSKEAIMVSPYFVPSNQVVTRLRSWVKSGAKVTILTNSLAATDVPAVHSGYMPYRRGLLESGVDLWEFKPGLRESSMPNKKKQKASSIASLHAKTMIFDRRYIFIGSMNLDPRSININSEVGLLFDAPAMANMIVDGLLRDLPDHAYQLTLNKNKNPCEILWHDYKDTMTKQSVVCADPETGFWRKIQVWLLSLLPIEKLL